MTSVNGQEGSYMTDGMETGTAPSSDTSSSPVSSSVSEAPVSQAQERHFKQSEVNDIIKREKYGAVEDYKRSQAKSQPQVSNQSETYSQQPSHSHDDVRRIAAEESQRLRDEWIAEAHRQSNEQAAHQIVGDFFSKMSTGKELYNDFDDVTGNINFGKFPNAIHLANQMENTREMMYELGKDRTKLAALEQLAYMSPEDAMIQAQRLSKSIKDNAGARNQRMPNEPLSQLRPSISGTDSGQMSVKDLRAKYRA